MSFDWISRPIGELGRVVTGRTPPADRPEFWGVQIPFLTPTDMDGRRIVAETQRALSDVGHAAFGRIVIPKGVAVSCIGWQMGKAVLVRSPVVTNQQINSIVTDDSIVSADFLYYALVIHREETFRLGAGGSRTPIVNKSTFEKIRIRLPPIEEQRRIAAVLGAIDDKIELNRQMSRTLEKLTQTLFKSWFLTLQGHIDGANILANSLPDGWRLGSIDEVATNIRETVDPSGILSHTPYVGLEHIPRRSTPLEVWGQASDAGSAKSRFKAGDILFGKLRPYFHKVVPAPMDGVASTDVLVIRPRHPDWRWFAFGHLFSDAMVNHASASADGTKMPRANWSDLCRLPIAIPPQAKAAEFNNLVEPLFERISLNVRQTRTLIVLRDLLLPRLISGQLRVPASLDQTLKALSAEAAS